MSHQGITAIPNKTKTGISTLLTHFKWRAGSSTISIMAGQILEPLFSCSLYTELRIELYVKRHSCVAPGIQISKKEYTRGDVCHHCLRLSSTLTTPCVKLFIKYMQVPDNIPSVKRRKSVIKFRVWQAPTGGKSNLNYQYHHAVIIHRHSHITWQQSNSYGPLYSLDSQKLRINTVATFKGARAVDDRKKHLRIRKEKYPCCQTL